MTAAERSRRSALADALCATAYDSVGGPDAGVALVAVGGYGRRELAPCSDLDVVLVHDDGVEPGGLAGELWYPLWDSGARVDHSVRSFSEMVAAAGADLRVALGLLDLRHLAGDPHLALRLRTTMLAGWRRSARHRLPELATLVRRRHESVGELAHLSVPDLKEAQGGLRDATVLRALVATWLVDVPHVELERCRQAALDVRDQLHVVTGRPGDRVPPEAWPDLAVALGAPDAVAAQRQVRESGRRIAHISRLTWRRVDAVLARPAHTAGPRRPRLEPLAAGLAVSSGEVVLDGRLDPADDPCLLLRAAAEAAERDLVLAPVTVARLVTESPSLPEPWPEAARQLLVRLLAAGPGLRAVWETLEETGGLAGLLPEWERIRLLPHASAIHRFTVDRHVVETCVEAAALIRGVARPDILLVAALLHDIGKGGLLEHSVAGEAVARDVATRMGFGEDDTRLVATLVRHHLLLPEVATSRDPDDPATVHHVLARVPDREALVLLAALTEADARAASPKAWSPWRAGLVRRLVAAATAVLDPDTPAPPVGDGASVPTPDAGIDPREVLVRVEPDPGGARLTVVAPDRVGLLADVAAVLALQRCPVHAARAWTTDTPDGQAVGVSVWHVADEHLDAAVVRHQLAAVTEGRRTVGERLGRVPVPGRLEPAIVVHQAASDSATVVEVRTGDHLGVIHVVCAALAGLGMTVRSAHVATIGPQAVDVFYVQEAAAGALSDERAAEATHELRRALTTGASGRTGQDRSPVSPP